MSRAQTRTCRHDRDVESLPEDGLVELGHCPVCSARLARRLEQRRLLRTLASEKPPPVDLWSAVREQVRHLKA